MESIPSLLIDGAWRSTPRGSPVINPATGATLGHVAQAGSAETTAAIVAATRALVQWRRTSGMERAALLDRAARLLVERVEPIARALSQETGKLLPEARDEVHAAADYCAWFAGEARRLEWASGVSGRYGGPQLVLRKPVGVAAILTPWNFPVSLQARKLAAALAAGCTAVARPSAQAPLAVVALFECLVAAGLPAGVANLLTGPAAAITSTLLDDNRVRVISFTGSTPVGRDLYARAARTVKRLALELGGCAPFIVCGDADLNLALDQALLAKFRNCGQSCFAANCFFVAQRAYPAFVAGLADRIAALRLGDPSDATTTIGPLISPQRRHSVEQVRDQALDIGFELIATAPALAPVAGMAPDCFLPPTLLAAPNFKLIDPDFLEQEVFGPLALVVGFDDLDDLLLELAQQPLGLAAYVFSGDTGHAIQVAACLEVGVTGINDGLPCAANAPMGGVKQSGLGREGGNAGIETFLDTHYLALGSPLVG